MKIRKTLQKTATIVVTAVNSLFLGATVHAASLPYPMASGNYTNNFSDMVNWPAGLGGTATTASNWSPVAVNSSGSIPDGVKTTVSSATFSTGSSGGVQTNSPVGSMTLLTTGSTDNSSSLAIDLLLDFTGRNAGTLSFDWAEVNNSSGNRTGSVRVYTSTDGTIWTELADAAVLNVVNNVAASGSIATVALPTEFTGSATARIRFYYYNGTGGTTGSRPKIAIDNLSVTSTGASGTPPSITDISPLNITTNAGSTVSYTVSSTGDAPAYFWYKETVSATNLIPGATTATLTLSDVSAADTAGYQVILTNSSGSATSTVATLTVTDPAILSQSTSQARLVGSSVSLAVSAVGTPTLGYQWYVKPSSDNFDFTGMSPLSNGGTISGADTSVLTITNLAYTDATNYFIVVTNGLGNSSTSSVVTLTVVNSGSLAYWNFNGNLNITNPATFQGVGTAMAVNCSSFSNNIYSGLDFDFSSTPNAWGTSGYPAAGDSNKTAGVQFDVSTLGAKNIMVSYDTRATSTGSKFERLQYSTNGTDFIDFPTSYSFVQAINYESHAFNLTGFPGAANNANFAIRIVTEFESTATYGVTNDPEYIGNTSTYNSSGTVSYDIVNITAEAITNANTPPFISALTNMVILDTNTTPTPQNFSIGDLETAGMSVANVSVVSSNQTVMPDSNIGLNGSGTNITVSFTPVLNALGVAPILVKVTDGDGDVTTAWFYITVNPGNFPPTISGLMDTNTLGNITNTYAFTVSDDLTPAGNLTVSAVSGNTTLVPNDASHISFGGSGSSRTINVASATDQYGVAPITVWVSDGQKSNSMPFVLEVRPNTITALYEGFDYDASGSIVDVSDGFWATHSGTPKQMQVGSGVVTVTDNNSEDVNAQLLGQPYNSSSGKVLYSSFTLNFSSLPSATNSYFAHFKDASTSGFFGRVYATTATAATNGNYRIGIGNASATTSPGQFPQDLQPGVNYTVVTRLVLSNGLCTIWVNPTDESSLSTTDTTAAGAPNPITSYALRESSGEGTLALANLKVGLNFLSVISNIVDVLPQANPDSYSIAGNSTNNVFSPLTNDVLNLPQGSLSLVSVSPTNGTATISGTNILFSPIYGFAGTATVGYMITDGFGGTSSSVITVDVASVAPTSEPINIQTQAGQLIMSWTQPTFSLASSTNVAGPYQKIVGATSPYTNNVTSGTMFFKLVYP